MIQVIPSIIFLFCFLGIQCSDCNQSLLNFCITSIIVTHILGNEWNISIISVVKCNKNERHSCSNLYSFLWWYHFDLLRCISCILKIALRNKSGNLDTPQQKQGSTGALLQRFWGSKTEILEGKFYAFFIFIFLFLELSRLDKPQTFIDRS